MEKRKKLIENIMSDDSEFKRNVKEFERDLQELERTINAEKLKHAESAQYRLELADNCLKIAGFFGILSIALSLLSMTIQ